MLHTQLKAGDWIEVRVADVLVATVTIERTSSGSVRLSLEGDKATFDIEKGRDDAGS